VPEQSHYPSAIEYARVCSHELLHIELKKLPTKLRSWQFLLIVSAPVYLTAGFCIVLVHDLFSNGASYLANQPISQCWLAKVDRHEMSFWPAWGGLAMQWLNRDIYGGQVYCNTVLRPFALWAYLTVLPAVWVLMIYTSQKVRRMSSTKGLIYEKTKAMIDENGEEECDELVHAFLGDISVTQKKHYYYLMVFQAVMLLIDIFLLGLTVRNVVAYQVVWLGFAMSFLQVRPYIILCVLLSETMIDRFIRRLIACNETKSSLWLQMVKEHNELELDISGIWIKVNLLVFVPPIPFLTFAVLHLVTDPNFKAGCVTALFLAITAGSAFMSLLIPIARISSMFCSTAAYKGKPTDKRGRMSIRAVTRSLAGALRSSKPGDVQDFSVLLEYVQGHKFGVPVGLPGVFLFIITKRSVASFFFSFMVKFPILISAFLALRNSFL